MLKKELLPSLLIILMGTMDCITTVIGVAYQGAKELNPVMAGIVSTNVGAFLVIKIGATVFIAATYLIARQMLMQLPNKNGRAYNCSFKFLIVIYAGLIAFLALAVANNLLILIK
jgi:hypothetical protein